MIWWLLPKGTTRSLSELGRETFARQWYSSLSCGRVGHCQIFYILFITVLVFIFVYIPSYNRPNPRAIFLYQNLVYIMIENFVYFR